MPGRVIRRMACRCGPDSSLRPPAPAFPNMDRAPQTTHRPLPRRNHFAQTAVYTGTDRLIAGINTVRARIGEERQPHVGRPPRQVRVPTRFRLGVIEVFRIVIAVDQKQRRRGRQDIELWPMHDLPIEHQLTGRVVGIVREGVGAERIAQINVKVRIVGAGLPATSSTARLANRARRTDTAPQ